MTNLSTTVSVYSSFPSLIVNGVPFLSEKYHSLDNHRYGHTSYNWIFNHMSVNFVLNQGQLVCLFVCLFRAKPAAYGSSQARDWIRAAAASLYHSRSNAGSEPRLQPTPQFKVNTRSLTHWARPRIEPASSWMLIRFVSTEPQCELPEKTAEGWPRDATPSQMNVFLNDRLSSSVRRTLNRVNVRVLDVFPTGLLLSSHPNF